MRIGQATGVRFEGTGYGGQSEEEEPMGGNLLTTSEFAVRSGAAARFECPSLRG